EQYNKKTDKVRKVKSAVIDWLYGTMPLTNVALTGQVRWAVWLVGMRLLREQILSLSIYMLQGEAIDNSRDTLHNNSHWNQGEGRGIGYKRANQNNARTLS
ncbi:hypothetical protein J6590_098937, partial [Homalodisca vitripennis]